MRCKRCRATVPDEAEICPHCGQDLSSLKQLLRSFYEEEPRPQADKEIDLSPPEDTPASSREEIPIIIRGPREISDIERLEFDSQFSLQDQLSIDEPLPGEENTGPLQETLRGGFWRRSIAFLIDQLVLLSTFVIFLVLGFLAAEMGAQSARGLHLLDQVRLILPLFLPMALLLTLAYFSFFHGAFGQTIGKMITGVRIVQINGQPLSFSRALARTFAYLISTMPFFLGFLWVGFSSSKRSWHDLIAGTIVIREQ